MKILTTKKQEKLMALISSAQKHANKGDYVNLTNCLCEIATLTLSTNQFCAITNELSKKEK